MLDLNGLLTLSLAAVLPRASSASGGRGIRLWLRGRRHRAHFVAVHLLLVPAGARGTGPPVTASWFGKKRGLDTGHVKVILASVTFYRLWTGWPQAVSVILLHVGLSVRWAPLLTVTA